MDTINGFIGAGAVPPTDDLLDFTAFLVVPTVQNAVVANGATGDLNMTAANVGVMFGKGSLANGDVKLAGTAAFGEVILADNGKAVVLVTADADGVSDATNQSYLVYYVQDTNAAFGTSAFMATLVGTINSDTELTAANLLVGGNGGDIFV